MVRSLFEKIQYLDPENITSPEDFYNILISGYHRDEISTIDQELKNTSIRYECVFTNNPTPTYELKAIFDKDFAEIVSELMPGIQRLVMNVYSDEWYKSIYFTMLHVLYCYLYDSSIENSGYTDENLSLLASYIETLMLMDSRSSTYLENCLFSYLYFCYKRELPACIKNYCNERRNLESWLHSVEKRLREVEKELEKKRSKFINPTPPLFCNKNTEKMHFNHAHDIPSEDISGEIDTLDIIKSYMDIIVSKYKEQDEDLGIIKSDVQRVSDADQEHLQDILMDIMKRYDT